MKLQSLTARNFMPYKGTLELTFPQDEQRNIMIIFGDNMRGKTSLLNALRWSFYNEAIGRNSRPIPLHELVNRDATLEDDWSMEVCVKFDANGRSYDLRRIVEKKKHVNSPSRTDDFTHQIFLTRDGSVVPGNQIDAEIGTIVPKQVSRFFLFDGELLQEYETLLIEDSQQGKKIKDAIESVLGVPTLTKGRVDIQTILKQARKRQNVELKQVAGLEKQAARIEELTVKIDTIDRDLENMNNKLKDLQKEIKSLGQEIEASQSVISAKATLDAFKKEQKHIIELNEIKENEKLDLMASAWKDIIDSLLQIKRNQLEKKREDLFNSIKNRSYLDQRIYDLKHLLEKCICPICEQVLNPDDRYKIGEILGDTETEFSLIDDTSYELNIISSNIEELSKIRGTNARERFIEIEKDLQRNNVRLTEIENQIEILNDEISGYDTAEISRKRRLLDGKLKTEGNLQRNIDDQDEVKRGFTDELAISQKALEGFTKNNMQRGTIKVSLCTDLEKLFNESIERLRDKLRENVETLANEAFMKMTTQKGYRGLKINDNYGLNIIDASGQQVPVRSAGAEQIVALSLIDGLNQTGRSSGPIIMDTPFGRLDLKHRDNILSYLPSVTSQFILLVHSGEIRKETDLEIIASKIGAAYEISEVSSTQSKLERVTL